MKHLGEYMLECLLYEKKETIVTGIPDEYINELMKLAKNSTLTDYVKQLNEMLNNKDAVNILTKAFGDSKKGYKFDGNFKEIPVRKLHPTQSEIDIENSLGYPFENGKEEAEVNGRRYYGSDSVSMPFPLITFNGTFILDGHHRWSQVYAFNKNASMHCFDLTLSPKSDYKRLTATTMLKITQGFIAAKYAKEGKKELPQSTANPKNNIFTMTPQKIKKIVLSYVNNHKEEADILAKCAKLDSAKEFATLLTNNIEDLKENNKKYIDKAKSKGNVRDVMPQTDKGGTGEKGKTNARPEDEDSALNLMTRGKTSIRALKNK